MFQSLLQRFAGIPDMLAQHLAGLPDRALTAEFQNLVMFFIGALDAVSWVKLQAGVALSVVVAVADHRREPRLGARTTH